MRVWEAISGPVWGMVWEVDSGSNSGHIWTLFWTLSRKPHEIPQISLHTAVGRTLRLNMTEIWVSEGPG